MAETITQISNRLRTTYPELYEGSSHTSITGDAYEAEILRMATNEREQQIAEEAAETKRQIRRQARQALTILNGPNGNDGDIARLADNNGMTVAQMRPIVLRMARIEQGLIEALISLDLLEDG